ncbi:eCIS core domain-containing protein [Nostoc sp.]
MTSKRIAQTNQQQKSDKPQESGILQRAAVRPVSDAGIQSTDDQEEVALSNSAFSKDFSRVPISTTKPQPIMAKLTIGAVGDKYEQEADRVAAQVVQRINAPVRSGEDETVQREEMETKDNEARLMRSPIIQRKSSDGGIAATPNLEASINRARSGGQPIANNIRQPMEKAFGTDFSGVKIHTDAQSDKLNRSIQARAFTTRQNVFFRQGEYNPGSRGGQELLAHELTHVVQQNGSAVQRSPQQWVVRRGNLTDKPIVESLELNAPKNNVQREYDQEGLKQTIEGVYLNAQKESKNPTQSNFVQALKAFVEKSDKSAEEIFNDPKFAWQLMELVGTESGKNLHQEIIDTSSKKYKTILFKNTNVYNSTWTLRHYTTSENNDQKPSYTKLKSTAELLVSGIKEKSENTNDADWNQIGNVGFSFYLLCIGGKTPNRSFLSTSTHYAEFDLSEIPNMFVSGDMLSATAANGEKKPSGFSGNAEQIKQELCSLTNLDRSDPTRFLSGLDTMFKNFEVKVPGQLTVQNWIKK